MRGRRADLLTPAGFRLPEGWGEAWLEPGGREHPGPPGAVRRSRPGGASRTARSYDHRGTLLVWRPGAVGARAAGFACDLEHVARFGGAADPGAVDGRFRIEPWVVTEVVAKLTRTPVLALLKRIGLVTIPTGPVASVDLDALGLSGVARICLTASADQAHVAAFGVLRERPRGERAAPGAGGR